MRFGGGVQYGVTAGRYGSGPDLKSAETTVARVGTREAARRASLSRFELMGRSELVPSDRIPGSILPPFIKAGLRGERKSLRVGRSNCLSMGHVESDGDVDGTRGAILGIAGARGWEARMCVAIRHVQVVIRGR